MGNRKNSTKTNRKIEKRELRFHIYLNPSIRKQYIRIYDVLADNHDRIYHAVYERLYTRTEEEMEKYKREAEDLLKGNYSEYVDYAEEMANYVYERLDEQFLMHYQFELMSLSNLYQVFEQQLRNWLFDEVTHNENEFLNQVIFPDKTNWLGDFYTNFGQINKALTELQFTFEDPLFGTKELIVKSDIWKTIYECTLISNTYKHGSGDSEKKLFQLKPEYFKKTGETRLIDLYGTTNTERVLDIEKIEYKKYCSAMKKFWERIEEHQKGTLTMKVDVTEENVNMK